MRYFVPNIETIPHGSGIDYDWNFDYTGNGKFKMSNCYHGMNSVGYYDGYAEFTVSISVFRPMDFDIKFHGTGFRHKAWFYGLHEYLDDIFAEWIKSCTMEIL